MVAPPPCRPQTRATGGPSSRDASVKTESYVDFSLPKLLDAVSELHGLKPDPNQHQLPFLLMRVGQVTEDLLQKMPNPIEAPVHAKAGPVPTDHGLRGNDNERLLPCIPKPASEHPEEFVSSARSLGLGLLALQYRELLPKRQILQGQASA